MTIRNKIAALGTKLRELRRDRRGNVLTEMALVMPIFATLGMGAFDMGRFAIEHSRMENAARAGAQVVLQNRNMLGNAAMIEEYAVRAATVAAGPGVDHLVVKAEIVCECIDINGALEVVACASLCTVSGNFPLTSLTVTAENRIEPVFQVKGFLERRQVVGSFTVQP